MTVRALTQWAPIAAVAFVAACSPTAQSIPHYTDAAGVTRVLKSLSPWKDGSPDRSHDGRTQGDPDSDRQLFLRWFMRYGNHEEYAQHSRDYEPFDVPGSVREAIDQQRKYEQELVARQDAQAAAEDAEEQRRAAAEKAEQAAAKAQQERENAAAEVERAKQLAENQRLEDARQAEMRANDDCREARMTALSKAAMDPVDPQGAMARVRATIPRCRSDGP